MAASRLDVKRGDRPRLTGTVTFPPGSDLTGATAKMLLKEVGGATAKVNAAAVIDGTTGTGTAPVVVAAHYDCGVSDLDTAGYYFAEFEVTANSRPLTGPGEGYLLLVVNPDLG